MPIVTVRPACARGARVIASALVVIACAAWWPSSARAAQPSAIDRVLSAHRSAMGAFMRPATVELQYAVSTPAMSGVARSTFDRRTGAYVDRYQIGLSRGASGFDGRLAWMEDISGAATPQDGGDRRTVAVNEAYRKADRWWRADRGGARIELLGRETMDGAAADHLRVTPRGGKPFDAWFDAARHHLVRLEEQQQFLRIVSRFADYRAEHGMVVAHTVTVDDGSGPAGMQTLRLTGLAIAPARPRAAYALPAWRPRDAAIDGGAAGTVVPIRLVNNHVYVDVMVNGQGPFPFIVDTGGHTILTPSTLARLQLHSEGSSPSAGAGEKTTTNGFVRVREIAVGGMRLRDQTAFTLDFAARDTEGFDVGGMIGFEVFRRFVVRIDYGALTMTIIDPARFDARDAGTPIPFRFYDHLPQVDGRFGDLPGRFDIDTGSRSELDLTTPFVEGAHLRARYPRGVLAITGWGVGGPVRSYVVRGALVTLGSVSVEKPVVSLSTSRAGSFSDPNYEGNVGSGLLKRFVVTFDYAHQRMYLTPLVPAPVDAGTFDRSGLWINLASDGFLVVDVAAGSPAEQAGLAVGDVIRALDGQPAAALALSDARMALRAPPPGTIVAIDYVHAGAARHADITLRSQLDER